MSEIDHAFPVFFENRHEEEVHSLKKQMRGQEAEWRKNKAVLEQRIEILELQNKELKDREENFKKMNNSIFSALKDFNKENDPIYTKIVRELEAAKEQVSREFADHKIRSQEIIKNLEKENQDLKEKVAGLELKCSQITLHYEKNDSSMQQKVQNLENEKNHLGLVLKLYEDERKQQKEKIPDQSDLQTRLEGLRYALENQKEEHRKAVEKVHYEYRQTINNMRLLAESEKSVLESQIHKLLDSKKLDGTLFEDVKKSYEGEAALLRKERDNMIRKNEVLERQVYHLAESLKTYEDKTSQQKAEQDKESKDLKRMRQRIADYESQLKKLEQSEKGFKQLITEKDFKIEEITADYKKKLSSEKRRCEQAQDLAKKYKEEGERKSSLIMQESIKKDETIKKLKAQIKNKDEKLNQKNDNDPNKTNTSLVNISLVSQSISASKYNPSRSFVQEIKTTRDPSTGNSRSLTQIRKSHSKQPQKSSGKDTNRLDTNEDEEDLKDLTSENILLGLNSPRTANSTGHNTYRNTSSNKKSKEFIMKSISKNNEKFFSSSKKGEKPMLSINLGDSCNHGVNINARMDTDGEVASFSQRDNGLNCTITVEAPNLFNTSFEFKKKSGSFCEVGPAGKTGRMPSENNRGYLNIGDLADSTTLSGTRNNNFSKNGVSGNQNTFTLSQNFQEMFETSKNNMSILQQSGVTDFYEGLMRGKRRYTEDGTKVAEDKLRQAEEKTEKMAWEKEKLQVELDRLLLELKQTKMEMALSEESKEECELALKNEIKFLINKLLQVKGNEKMTASQAELYQSKSATKSILEGQGSFINTSEFLNVSHSQPNGHFVSSFISQPEQNNFNIIQNNLAGRKSGSLERRPAKKAAKIDPEDFQSPLKTKCLNSSDFEMESPNRRVSEFNSNGNNLLNNLLTTSTNPKKSLRDIKR